MKLMLACPSRRRSFSLLLPLAALLPLSVAFPAQAQEAPPATPAPASAPTGPAPASSPAGSSSSWSTAPTSSSGAGLGSPAKPVSNAEPEVASSDVEARIKALEAKLGAMQEKSDKRNKALEWLEHIKLSGYVQPQLIWQSTNDAGSLNVGSDGRLPAGIGANSTMAKPDGTTTNPDFFRLRRARLKAELRPSEYAKVVIEIEPNLTGGTAAGTGTIARNVEAVGTVPWSKDVKTEIGMGIFVVPFGYEPQQSNADRPFIERSWMVQNLLPGEYDTGVRQTTTALDKKLTIQTAVVNGTTQGEKNFTVLPDLNKGKDVVGRVNFNPGPFDVGVSGLAGTGSVVDATQLRFKQFRRWAVNFEAGVHHKLLKNLGTTKLFAELSLAQNLDRGTKYSFGLPTIPTNINDDVADKDQRGMSVRIEQDLTEWVTLGARYDMYTPDSAQKNNARDAYSFVTAVNFTKGLKLMVEYDYAIDNVHRAGAQAPSKKTHIFSTVLQARF